MKKEKLLALSLLIILSSSCQTQVGTYFNRPDILPTINGEGTGFRNGVEIDTTNFICVDPKEYGIIQDYYEDKEYRLFMCLRHNRCK